MSEFVIFAWGTVIGAYAMLLVMAWQHDTGKGWWRDDSQK